ncbi:MAG: ribonuclease P protein subunit [Methanomassiliicoccales archaeon]
MKKRDFMRMEFIGLEVEVIESNHPGYLHIAGTVVDETKNTITIATGKKEVMVPKPSNTFQFTWGSEKITVQGTEIQHRPEDRIKKIR